MKYIAKLKRESGAVLVSFPDAPGCQTFGKTKEKALREAREALEGWLETSLQDGELPPRPCFVGRGVAVGIDAALALKLELRWARSERGLSQAEVAKLVGVSQQRIAALEHPDTEVKLSTATRVLAVLGRTLDISTSTERPAA